MGDMTLRDLLLRDFGKELPISEGWGKKDDPIVITVQDSQEVSRTELEVIRYIAKVHGWIWRKVGHDVFADEDGRIEKIYIDVKYIENEFAEEVITEKRSFYFRVMLNENEDVVQTPKIELSGAFSDFKFPFNIGWIHFDKIINNEKVIPGAGFSIAYSAPFINGMFYVYRDDREVKILKKTTSSTQTEYSAIIKSIISHDKQAKIIIDEYDGVIFRICYQTIKGYSFIILAPYNDIFIKFRMSLYCEYGFLWNCAVDTFKIIYLATKNKIDDFEKSAKTP